MLVRARRKIRLILGLLLLLGLFGCAQEPPIEGVKGAAGSHAVVSWVAAHARPQEGFNDLFWPHSSLAVDSDGSAYLLDTQSKYRSRGGWWLRKYGPDGIPAWTVKMPSQPGQKLVPQSVALDPNGDLVIVAAGMRAHRGTYLYKYSRDGKMIWQTTHRMRAKSKGGQFNIAFSPESDIYIGGTGIEDSMRKPWIGRFSSSGKLKWEQYELDRGMTWGGGKYIEYHGGLIMLYTNEHSTDDSIKDAARQLYFRPDGKTASPDEVQANYLSTGNREPSLPSSERLSLDGPRGFWYDVPKYAPHSLNAWLEIGRGRTFLRLEVAQARQAPGDRALLAKQLAVDGSGAAYLTTLETGGNKWYTRLYKVDIELPKVSQEIRVAAKKALMNRPPRLIKIIAKARQRDLSAHAQDLLDALTPLAAFIDERNARLSSGALALSRAKDYQALKYFRRPTDMTRWGGYDTWEEPSINYSHTKKTRALEQQLNVAGTLRISGRLSVAEGIEALDIRGIKKGFKEIKKAHDKYHKVARVIKRIK